MSKKTLLGTLKGEMGEMGDIVHIVELLPGCFTSCDFRLSHYIWAGASGETKLSFLAIILNSLVY